MNKDNLSELTNLMGKTISSVRFYETSVEIYDDNDDIIAVLDLNEQEEEVDKGAELILATDKEITLETNEYKDAFGIEDGDEFVAEVKTDDFQSDNLSGVVGATGAYIPIEKTITLRKK